MCHLKCESLIEDWIQSFPMNFSFELLLLIREQVNFHVRIWSATHVQGG